ncbi:MAG: M28 family peptidase [Gemmatimonadales bacterium]|nr:MAG: M28 family peptidase [Gemmatimonadales bacterium]
MEGRQTGTPGGDRAQAWLVEEFERRGIPDLNGTRTMPFDFVPRGGDTELEGVNILGWIEGSVHPERYIVVTAHYDHLGVRNGEIYNGADDNASGTAAILEIAGWFRDNPPRHSILVVAMDAEEMGLQGARAFIAEPPVPLDRVVMNVNLDMVSRNEDDELYAAGTYHYPFLAPLVEEAADHSGISLLMGHDSPDLPPGDDWTMSSDHGPFHQAGIPFIYFGVEDHPGYHDPTDTADRITPEFYVEAVETALDFILLADRRGERILEERAALSAAAAGVGN